MVCKLPGPIRFNFDAPQKSIQLFFCMCTRNTSPSIRLVFLDVQWCEIHVAQPRQVTDSNREVAGSDVGLSTSKTQPTSTTCIASLSWASKLLGIGKWQLFALEPLDSSWSGVVGVINAWWSIGSPKKNGLGKHFEKWKFEKGRWTAPNLMPRVRAKLGNKHLKKLLVFLLWSPTLPHLGFVQPLESCRCET